MRCKYCDRRLEPHQYKWNEESKEWVETCGGKCVGYVPQDVADMVEEEDSDPTEVDYGVTQWVPEGQ